MSKRVKHYSHTNLRVGIRVKALPLQSRKQIEKRKKKKHSLSPSNMSLTTNLITPEKVGCLNELARVANSCSQNKTYM